MSQTVSFHQMKDGTREDYQLLASLEHDYTNSLAHSRQTATRAQRDGADKELLIAALVHDIGDDLSPYNHAAVAAEILRPYVRAEVTWIVEQHGLFQSYYYAHHNGHDRNGRDRFRGHRWFDACAAFCERWDQAAFDPRYKTEPLTHFEPLVREIFSRPAQDAMHD